MCDLSSHQHLVKVSALVTDERVNEAFGERRVEPDRYLSLQCLLGLVSI